MKKTFATFLVVLFAGVYTHASDKENPSSAKMTTSVNGTVTDKENGEVLAGVAVKLAGTEIIVYSDLDGNFRFEDLKQGKYQVESDLISYKKKSEEVKIELKKENKVELELENLQ